MKVKVAKPKSAVYPPWIIETAYLKKDPTWRTWKSMMERCYYSKLNAFPLYGGRGILVDISWFSFEQFRDDMGTRLEGMTLDRIDPNQGYSKDNCRWATVGVQAANKRTRRKSKYVGVYFASYGSRKRPWIGEVIVDGKRYRVTGTTEKEAADLLMAKKRELQSKRTAWRTLTPK